MKRIRLFRARDVVGWCDDAGTDFVWIPIILCSLTSILVGYNLSLHWSVIYYYLGGVLLTYLSSAILVELESDRKRKELMGLIVCWPGLYIILIICNVFYNLGCFLYDPVGIFLYRFHSHLFNFHKALATKKIFVKKPGLLKDRPMPKLGEYRDNAVCSECSRPK